jgi:hypothetical protein
MSVLESAFQEVNQLKTIEPETLKVPKTRIPNAASARKIYDKMREADRVNSQNRAMQQAMFDGEPPYDDQELIASGQGHRCNLNFDEAAGLLESSLGGYVDLLESVEVLITTPLSKKKFPASDQRFEQEQVIAEEFTRILREWDKFDFNHLLLSTYFIKFGVGFAYFPDEQDWRWSVDCMANVFVPRRTFATESEIEVTCIARKYQAHQLYRFIKNEESAKVMGWNITATKRAISMACSPNHTNGDDFEKYADDLKNNDFYTGYATASEIAVVHYYWQEFNGTVSHCIGLEHSAKDNRVEKDEEFLYVNRSRYQEMSEAMIAFTYGIGTNGYFHGIRGLGYKIFPQIQVSNRAHCQSIDGAMMASSVMIQAKTDDAMDDLELMYFGPYTVLSSGFDVVEQRAMPNLSQNIMPVLANMSSMLQAKTGQYQAGASKTERQSKFEKQIEVTQGAKLGATGLVLFYKPFQRLMRQVGRRMTTPKYAKDDPGGKWVHEFWQRCVDRGVPLDVVQSVDWKQAKVAKAIGGGSPEMRLLVLDELAPFAANMDTVGRQNWMRDKAAARLGYDQASRYFPPSTERRIAADAKVAGFENALMSLQQPMEVSPGDDHIEHADIHLPRIIQIVEQQAPDTLAQAIPILILFLEHASEHVAQLDGNQIMEQRTAEMRQILQQAGEIAHNGALQLQKMEREAAEQQGQQAPEQDNELVKDSIRFQAKMENLQKEAELKLAIKEREHQQQMAFRDADKARKLLQDTTQ